MGFSLILSSARFTLLLSNIEAVSLRLVNLFTLWMFFVQVQFRIVPTLLYRHLAAAFVGEVNV